MKKVGFIAAAIIAVSFASCNKCHECHYDHDGMEHELGEFCGDELEDVEANGYSINDSTVVTVHCEEH